MIALPVIGLLSPEGKFARCNSWGHMSLAKKLCEKAGLTFDNSFEAEKHLLNEGWVCFRSRDAFMNFYKETALSKSDFGKREMNLLTAKQIAFIKRQQDQWNCLEQYEDVLRILRDNEGYKELFEESEEKHNGQT